jgi:hypothetical protein
MKYVTWARTNYSVQMRPTFSHSLDPKQKYMTDRYRKGAYPDPHKNP